MNERGIGLILHSGSPDRLVHGLSIALAYSALGRRVRVLFTYWALEFLKRGHDGLSGRDAHLGDCREIMEKHIEAGNLESIPELIKQLKGMKARIYACTNSMGILNIARDELVDEVDRSMGLTTFLSETPDDRIVFI